VPDRIQETEMSRKDKIALVFSAFMLMAVSRLLWAFGRTL
jgi:hypothetical protein